MPRRVDESSGELSIDLLGSLRVSVGGRLVELTTSRLRALVAALAVSAGRPMSVERLAALVWGETPPMDIRRTVQVYVVRLRDILGADAIRTVAYGYELSVEPEDVDALRFERLLSEAATASDAGSRRARLAEALALWRGRPFEDVQSAWLQDVEAPRLVERYLDALERRIGLDLADGRHAPLIAELGNLTAEYPLRERFQEQLMLALYRSGRQADALATYQRLRTMLAEELGVEPCDSVRDLHQRILTADTDLNSPSSAAVESRSTPACPVIPAQLPADVRAFIGRGVELARLDETLTGDETSRPADGDLPTVASGSAAMVISVVAGTAGVGKTALAIRWANRVRGHFPDGQLYVNLRGYDPDQPRDPGDVLARFLTTLGVPAPQIPLDLDERAARFRTEIAGKRMLIVLDNASSVEQVRPLLPGTVSCAVVVTSRDSLAGLVAIDGARRLDLDLLSPDEAVALLRWLIGPRVDAEPRAAATLAELCARLPLALRVAAELAVSRPHAPLAELVSELVDARARLEKLAAGGDSRAAVAAVFSWSVRYLPPDCARIFRLLGLHPGPDFDAYAAAALADAGLESTRHALGLLTRAHLIQPAGPSRYGMHDLLRAYAASLAEANAADDVAAALTQLFDYYLGAASTAMDQLYPAEKHYRPDVPAPRTAVRIFPDSHAAIAWLGAELPNLAAVVAYTEGRGWPTYAIQLSTTLFRYLEGRHFADMLTIHGHALQAAQQIGDVGDQADTLFGIGVAYRRLGRFEPALEHLNRALALYQQIGRTAGESRTLNVLGVVRMMLGQYRSAVTFFREALAKSQEAGDAISQGYALDDLGLIERRMGDDRSAAAYHEQALALFRLTGHQVGQATVLQSLGLIEQGQGRYDDAARRHEEALFLFRAAGHEAGEACELDNLAIAYQRLDRVEEAAEYRERALAIFRAVGDRAGMAYVHNAAGEAATEAGRPGDAIASHQAALAIAAEVDCREQEARAYVGLGQAHSALGHASTARTHYERAVDLYTEFGMPNVDALRAHLVELDSSVSG